MADIFSKEKRSDIMSRVKSSNTKPEVAIRKYLFANGIRFRINPKTLPGKPDIYVLKYEVAIFFHGCFWHGHQDCKHSKLPKSNKGYWENKMSRNVARDKLVIAKLHDLKVRTIVIWGCEIDTQAKSYDRLVRLLSEINTF